MADADCPVVHADRHLVRIDVETEQILDAEQEVAGVPPRVEGDDVAAEQAANQPLADPRGQHAPGLGTRPGDVHEMRQHHVRAAPPHAVSDKVEVVVLDQDEGPPVPLLDEARQLVGHLLVHARVAVLEGVVLGGGQDGRLGQPVQPVLDEPQNRVAEHAVELRLALLVNLDHVDEDVGALLALVGHMRHRSSDDPDRVPFRLPGHRRVLLGGGGADPDGVAEVLGEAEQGGHQAPAAFRHNPLPVGVAAEGDRAAMGEQDQRQFGCRVGHVWGHRFAGPSGFLLLWMHSAYLATSRPLARDGTTCSPGEPGS